MSNGANNQYVLIAGESASGKSASLRNLKNPERVAYFNCEVNKPLPFQHKFNEVKITDPMNLLSALSDAEESSNIDTIVIDSLTFWFDMLESQYVNNMDGYEGWKLYAQTFKNLMYQQIATSKKRIIVLAHNMDILDKNDATLKTQVPVKGALRNNGIESFFTTVVYATKQSVKKLEKDYKENNGLLNITEDEEIIGYKHVFQTKITKDTLHSRIRSPMGMFTKAQTFMDNDAELLLNHMAEFYGE